MSFLLPRLDQIDGLFVATEPDGKIGVEQAYHVVEFLRERNLADDLDVVTQQWDRFSREAQQLLAPMYASAGNRFSLFFAEDYLARHRPMDTTSRYVKVEQSWETPSEEARAAIFGVDRIVSALADLRAADNSAEEAAARVASLLDQWDSLLPQARQLLAFSLAPGIIDFFRRRDVRSLTPVMPGELELERRAAVSRSADAAEVRDARLWRLAEDEGLTGRSITTRDAVRFARAARWLPQGDAIESFELFRWVVAGFGPGSPKMLQGRLPANFLRPLRRDPPRLQLCQEIAAHLLTAELQEEDGDAREAARHLRQAADKYRLLGDQRSVRTRRLEWYARARELLALTQENRLDRETEAQLNEIASMSQALQARSLDGRIKRRRQHAHGVEFDRDAFSDRKLIAGEIPVTGFAWLLEKIQATHVSNVMRFAAPPERPRTRAELDAMIRLFAPDRIELGFALQTAWYAQDYPRWLAATPAARGALAENPGQEMEAVLRMVHVSSFQSESRTSTWAPMAIEELLPQEALEVPRALQLALFCVRGIDQDLVFPAIAAAVMRSPASLLFQGELACDALSPELRAMICQGMANYLQGRVIASEEVGAPGATTLRSYLGLGNESRQEIAGAAAARFEAAGDLFVGAAAAKPSHAEEFHQMSRSLYKVAGDLLAHAPAEQDRVRRKRDSLEAVSDDGAASRTRLVHRIGGFYTVDTEPRSVLQLQYFMHAAPSQEIALPEEAFRPWQSCALLPAMDHSAGMMLQLPVGALAPIVVLMPPRVVALR